MIIKAFVIKAFFLYKIDFAVLIKEFIFVMIGVYLKGCDLSDK